MAVYTRAFTVAVLKAEQKGKIVEVTSAEKLSLLHSCAMAHSAARRYADG
jgi:glutathionyl-hydroquinone reductase